MAKYRAVIHKILEDGTEIEEMRITDQPWYVAYMLASASQRLKRLQPSRPDPPQMEGQAGFQWEVAA